MSEDDPIRLSAFRAGKIDDGDRVPCAKCGRLIHADNARCPHCGIHFDGIACDFSESQREQAASRRRHWRIRWTSVALLIAITVFLVAAIVGSLT